LSYYLKFRIEELSAVSEVTSSKYLLNKFNCFGLRLESLDDTDDSMFVDFVGC